MVVTSSSVSEWAENADGFEEYRAEAETNLRGMIEALVLRCSARRNKAGLGATVLSNLRREDVALSARRRRSCRPVAPTHDPLLSAARVDADVLPTNGPRISPQTDWLLPYRDRSPIYTRHPDAGRGRIDAWPSRTLTPALQRRSIRS